MGLLVVMAEVENRIVVNQRHTKFLEPAGSVEVGALGPPPRHYIGE